MYWHIDADIISLIVLMAVYIYNIRIQPASEPTLQGRFFNNCVRTGAAASVVDLAASVIMEVPTPPFLYHLLMTLYFLIVEFVMVVWFFYAISIVYHDAPRRGRYVGAAVLLPYAVFAVVVCANPWTGVIYTLGENNAYARGPLFPVMMVLFAVYAVAMLFMILVRRRHISKGFGLLPVALLPVVMTLSIIVQLNVPGWLTILPGYMICVVIAFLFLQNEKTRSSKQQLSLLSKSSTTDALTGLLNRAGADAMLKQSQKDDAGESCVIAILDLDDLKSINDVLGHASGDLALRKISAQVKRHFRTTDVVARYGGDEFLIYLPCVKNQEHLSDSFRNLIEEISQLRIGDEEQYPLHVSVGAAFGPVSAESHAQLMANADTALYYVKCYGKNGFMFYHPNMRADKADALQEEPEGINGVSTEEKDGAYGGQDEKLRTLLIVDDSDMNRALLANILKGQYKTLEAADGQQALDVLHAQGKNISCVLLDIVMPKLDGYEVLRQLRADAELASIPVIVTTANSDVEAEVRALSLGAQDFVGKPYNPTVIRRRIGNIIHLTEMAALVETMTPPEDE